MERRVVVTGLGAITPCGNSVPETWSSMVEGRSGIGRLTRFDDETLAIVAAGEVKNFDAAASLGRKAQRRLGLFMQYAVVAADEAMAMAGLTGEGGAQMDRHLFATSIASGIGGIPEIVEESYRCRDEGVNRVSPLFIPRSLSNLAAGHLSMRYRALGPSMCYATACAAGNHAIGDAFRMIKLGEANVVLAGGAEAAISPLAFGGFGNMRALSTRSDDVTSASRPFDIDRDGFVMGEGAGILVLEELDHARSRGVSILAEVIGYAASNDAYHITAPSPDGEGAARCMQLAVERAGIQVEEVDYINAHGTSTPLNDRIETMAIRSVFQGHADRLLVSSTKGVTGHLLGAAGGVEAIASVLSLNTGWVPQTAHLQNPDPECDLNYVANASVQAFPRVVLSNGFGFGGTNGVVVFRRWEGESCES